MTAVRFLEDRVKSDPDDLVALNKLAGYYLQLYRETYNSKYLDLTFAIGARFAQGTYRRSKSCGS